MSCATVTMILCTFSGKHPFGLAKNYSPHELIHGSISRFLVSLQLRLSPRSGYENGSGTAFRAPFTLLTMVFSEYLPRLLLDGALFLGIMLTSGSAGWAQE